MAKINGQTEILCSCDCSSDDIEDPLNFNLRLVSAFEGQGTSDLNETQADLIAWLKAPTFLIRDPRALKVWVGRVLQDRANPGPSTANQTGAQA